MEKIEKIERLAKRFIQESGLDIPLIIESKNEKKNRSFGAYHVEKKSIILRKQMLLDEFEKQSKNGIFNEFESFLKVVIFHEIGHAQDKELEDLQNKKMKLLKGLSFVKSKEELDEQITKIIEVVLKAEKNAWDYAEKQLDESYKQSMILYKRMNIQAYINTFLFLREKEVSNLFLNRTKSEKN